MEKYAVIDVCFMKEFLGEDFDKWWEPIKDHASSIEPHIDEAYKAGNNYPYPNLEQYKKNKGYS